MPSKPTGVWQTYWQRQRLKQFKTFREFIITGPMEGGGCDFDPKYVQALLHKSSDAVVEAMFRRAMKQQGVRNDLRSNPTEVMADRGRAYTLERLMRERPELFAQVEAGKLSANAAAIEAGFRKKLTQLNSAAGFGKNSPKRQMPEMPRNRSGDPRSGRWSSIPLVCLNLQSRVRRLRLAKASARRGSPRRRNGAACASSTLLWNSKSQPTP
jgi:hypothetical protein